MTDIPESLALMTKQLTEDSLIEWDEDKRKEFVKAFDGRTRASRYILMRTARHVMEEARRKHFISDKHCRAGILPEYDDQTIYDHNQANAPIDRTSAYRVRMDGPVTVDGRSILELETIAKTRAAEIIEKLPSLTEAVRFISPEISKKMEERQKLLEKGKKLMKESEDVSGELNMADLDQDMTIRQFREQVKQRERTRLELLARLAEVGKEGQALQSSIDKFLYDGLPGLSDAVIKVVKDFVDRATAMAAFNRRVGEQVIYGDSEAAMEMLRSFEKDEVKVSSDIATQFETALETLKAAGKSMGVKVKKLKDGKK